MDTTVQNTIMLLFEFIITHYGELIITVIAGLLYQAFLVARTYVKNRVDSRILDEVSVLVSFVVKAAEQAGLTGALKATGEAKKQWAIEELQRLLNERGITNISVATLSTLIEAAIKDGLQNGWGESAALVPVEAHSVPMNGYCAVCGVNITDKLG